MQFTCAGCGAVREGRKLRRYCSNACQRASEREARVAEWLATGTATPDSRHNHYIRLHLLREQGNECALCEQPSSWRDLPLVFVLDHVDGDSTNNARANLRLVCPNCDSQLPTYKSRNRGRGRHLRRTRYAEGRSY